jgi:3-methyladenine DNA glycosylase AlkD
VVWHDLAMEGDVDIAAVVEELDARLRAAADPDRAPAEQAYLKSELVHLGVGVPATRRAVKATLREHGHLGREDLVAVVDALWSVEVYERRLAAVEVLTAKPPMTLSVTDANWLEGLLRACRTWALLDPLVIGAVSALVERDPSGWDPVVRRWAEDEDVWVRRAALLAHLPTLRRGEGDWVRFAELADPMLEEREFFVRKAIGWVLRETAKKRPQLVADWLEPRAHRAAGLTIREAVKPLPADDRDRILAARSSV